MRGGDRVSTLEATNAARRVGVASCAGCPPLPPPPPPHRPPLPHALTHQPHQRLFPQRQGEHAPERPRGPERADVGPPQELQRVSCFLGGLKGVPVYTARVMAGRGRAVSSRPGRRTAAQRKSSHVPPLPPTLNPPPQLLSHKTIPSGPPMQRIQIFSILYKILT